MALGLSTYYYSQYSANKKYSAYYMQESYLGNIDDEQSEEPDQATVAETFTDTKVDPDSEEKIDT